ncbi:GNAT family N-acetyltransferase [Rhodococcus hoagii]|nr:GNAT family N-acetyltransferase [Prescottella equi]
MGTAIWFRNFSTWDGVHGIYLEDLYVTPEHRGAGYGTALAGDARRGVRDEGINALAWSCLNWNTPSIGFYESLDAVAQTRDGT